MIGRDQIRLLDAVALAGAADRAGVVDTEAVEHQPRPAAPAAAAREPALGAENSVAAMRRDVAREIRFVAEQAEAILHLPADRELRVGGGLRARIPGYHQGNHRNEKCETAHFSS
jgi:hypothetical protein